MEDPDIQRILADQPKMRQPRPFERRDGVANVGAGAGAFAIAGDARVGVDADQRAAMLQFERLDGGDAHLPADGSGERFKSRQEGDGGRRREQAEQFAARQPHLAYLTPDFG